jgi:hypothetical protein
VNHRNIVGLGGLGRKIVGVECDHDLGMAADCRCEHMPVLRVASHSFNERLVADHFGIRKGPAHLADPVTDCLAGQSALLYEVALKFLQHPG